MRIEHLILVLSIYIRLEINKKAAPKERLAKENWVKTTGVRGRRFLSP